MWDFSFLFFIHFKEVIFIKRLLLVAITILLTFLFFSFSKTSLPSPIKGEVTSPYGTRINPITHKKEFHNATDISAPLGTPVLSPTDCVVTEIANDSIYGIFVKTQSDNLTFRFCHLSETSLKVGEKLKSGDEIGKVGDTGWATGPHLHLEMTRDGESVNPEKEMSFK